MKVAELQICSPSAADCDSSESHFSEHKVFWERHSKRAKGLRGCCKQGFENRNPREKKVETAIQDASVVRSCEDLKNLAFEMNLPSAS